MLMVAGTAGLPAPGRGPLVAQRGTVPACIEGAGVCFSTVGAAPFAHIGNTLHTAVLREQLLGTRVLRRLSHPEFRPYRQAPVRHARTAALVFVEDLQANTRIFQVIGQ